VGVSGALLRDGGVDRERARELIRNHRPSIHWKGRFQTTGKFNQLYGCNMMLRRSVLEHETFDEDLKGYTFGEDYDIWVRVSRYGITGKFDRCVAVHLKAPGGRSDPAKVAYSRLTNHWHFLRKGVSHLSPTRELARFLYTCVKFPCRSIRTSITGNKKGLRELYGYGRAMGDIILGKSHPSRVDLI
jgi:hypothetical protein